MFARQPSDAQISITFNISEAGIGLGFTCTSESGTPVEAGTPGKQEQEPCADRIALSEEPLTEECGAREAQKPAQDELFIAWEVSEAGVVLGVHCDRGPRAGTGEGGTGAARFAPDRCSEPTAVDRTTTPVVRATSAVPSPRAKSGCEGAEASRSGSGSPLPAPCLAPCLGRPPESELPVPDPVLSRILSGRYGCALDDLFRAAGVNKQFQRCVRLSLSDARLVCLSGVTTSAWSAAGVPEGTGVQVGCFPVVDGVRARWSDANRKPADGSRRPADGSQCLQHLARICSRLQALDVAECRWPVNESLPAVSDTCRDLRALNLQSCDVTDSSLTCIAERCPSIRWLSLRGCRQLSGGCIEECVSKWAGLEVLDLGWLRSVQDSTVVAAASSCSALSVLNLCGCAQVTDTALEAVARSCVALHALDLRECKKVTDTGVQAIAASCQLLGHLSLWDCPRISDTSVLAVARQCPLLRSAHLCHCSRLTDAAVQALVSRCGEIEVLDLSGCEALSDAALAAIAASCGGLKALKVQGCRRLTEEAMRALLWECGAHILELDLSYSRNYTRSLFLHIAERCPLLRALDAVGCKGMTDECIAAIRGGCPRMQRLNLGLRASIV